MIAEISRWLPNEPGSNMIRVMASNMLIKDVHAGLSYYNGLLHNYKNTPLIIDKTQLWCYFGKHHRENGPALINSDGMFWFRYGILHNDDGPAAILHNDDGPAGIIGESRLWYKNGRLHSYNDNPAIIHADGSLEYYADGLLHRDNAQAIHANDIDYYYTANVFIRKANPYNWKSWYQIGIGRFGRDHMYKILQLGKFVI